MILTFVQPRKVICLNILIYTIGCKYLHVKATFYTIYLKIAMVYLVLLTLNASECLSDPYHILLPMQRIRDRLKVLVKFSQPDHQGVSQHSDLL